MFENFEKLLGSCVGPLLGNGIVIAAFKKERAPGRYALEITGDVMQQDAVDVSIQWDPGWGSLMMAVPFELIGYQPHLRGQFLEMINTINSDSDKICTSILIEGETGMKALTRLTFVLHPAYLADDAWEFQRDLIRTNVMAVMAEMASACVMVGDMNQMVGTA